MRYWSLIYAVALAVVSGAAQESPLQWLQRAQQAESQRAVAGVRVVELQVGRTWQRIEERFWRQGARAERIEIVAPAARQGDVLLLRDGRWVVYRPAAKQAYELPRVPLQSTQLIQLAIELAQKGIVLAELGGESSVAGRTCVEVRLRLTRPTLTRPAASDKRPAFPFAVTLWLDKETGLILRRELAMRPSTPAMRVEITQLDLNPRLSPELFTLPAGVVVRPLEGDYKTVEEAQRAVPFPIRTPTYLPPNTTLERVLVRYRPMQETPLVILHYRTPTARFSLFQARQRGEVSPWKPRKPHQRLNTLFWREGDYAFGLVGDLPQAELGRIANSLRRATPHE